MADKHILNWTQDGKYTDGSVFGAVDFAGFSLLIDGKPGVSIPTAFSTAGSYSFDLETLALAYGTHLVSIVVASKNGGVSAASAVVSYTKTDQRVPTAPLAVTVT